MEPREEHEEDGAILRADLRIQANLRVFANCKVCAGPELWVDTELASGHGPCFVHNFHVVRVIGYAFLTYERLNTFKLRAIDEVL